MSTTLYTDQELDALRSMPKRVTNPQARWQEKPKSRPTHRQRGFQATGGQPGERQGETRFHVYLRQNLTDEADFSCGISYLPHGGQPLTLARYNGPSHVHDAISYRPHIHRTTERAIREGKKPESEAEETDRFESLEGALACLLQDFNVTGISARPDQPRLLP